MIDLGARMGGGHVTVQHPEYLDTPSLSRAVTGTDVLVETARKTPRSRGWWNGSPASSW